MEEDEKMRRGIHTLRGNIILPMTQPLRSALFNGSFTQNFEVISVQIFPEAIANNDTILVMHFDDNLKTTADASDNAQFGWATTDALAQDWSYVDPDHIIVNDLFVSAFAAAPGSVNYVIKLRRKKTTVSEAIFDEVKNKLQS